MVRKLSQVLICVGPLLLAGCGGSDSSSTTSSTTVTAPTITTQPTSVTVTAGQSASFSVTASGDSLTYQWYKTSAAISGATTATYTISSAATSDAASYYVVVTNSAGSVTSSTVTLTVNASSSSSSSPTITGQPSSLAAIAGSDAELSVLATGDSLTYQWSKDGGQISGATSATLQLSAVSSTDAGAYTVAVTNSSGSVTSSSATVTVTITVSYLHDRHARSQRYVCSGGIRGHANFFAALNGSIQHIVLYNGSAQYLQDPLVEPAWSEPCRHRL